MEFRLLRSYITLVHHPLHGLIRRNKHDFTSFRSAELDDPFPGQQSIRSAII